MIFSEGWKRKWYLGEDKKTHIADRVVRKYTLRWRRKNIDKRTNIMPDSVA